MKSYIRFSPVTILRSVAIIVCVGYAQADEIGERKFKIDASTFKCMLKMTAVRHFFVDNLAGNLEGTVAVAKAGRGEYPEGSLLQLIELSPNFGDGRPVRRRRLWADGQVWR